MRRLQDMADLRGRVALVTGGAGSIAKAAEEAFAEAGATVVVADRELSDCTERAGDIAAVGNGIAWAHEIDLADYAAVRSMVRRIIDKEGRLDIVAHCARYTGQDGYAKPFEEQTPEAFLDALSIDLVPILPLVQESSAALKRLMVAAALY